MFDKNKIKAVLFDMDGTLTDTEPTGLQVMQKVLTGMEIVPTKDEWKLFDQVWRRDGTDMSFEKFVEQILRDHNNDYDPVKFCNQFLNLYEEAIAEAPELPGATELLRRVSKKYSVGLITASTQGQAKTVLKRHQWTKYFNIVITQDEYKVKKPDPAGYLMAAHRLAISPAECVVVEDSKNGAKSGKNAGMYVIGVRVGNKDIQDLSAADRVVENLFGLSKILLTD